jgi:hypothetical protein
MATATKTKTKPVKKTDVTLTVHVVLDRSGSMQVVKDDTIGAFNEYVQTLARQAPDSTLSLTIFDTESIETIVDDKPIGDVPLLTANTYQPRGGTPLLDAIGKTAAKLTATKGKHKALVIITDGQENSSHEYKKETLKKLLDEKQEKDGWLVLYLGANQDAFAEAGQFGALTSNTMNYKTKNMMKGFEAAAASTVRYASSGGSLQAAAFTEKERTEADED